MSKNLLAQALKHHQAGETEIAEKLYRKVLAQDANNTEALHLLGILLGQQGKLSEALAPLQAALALQPDSAAIHNSLGNIYKHSNQIDLAIEHYQHALSSPQASAAVHNNLGTLYYKKGDLAQAAACYQQALAMYPDYADAHFNLSAVLTQQQQYDDAIAHLQAALVSKPQHAQAHYHLGQLLLQQGNLSAAINHYQQRLVLEPDHIETHHQLAVAFTQQSDWQHAIEHYERTLQLNPDHDEALHNLASLYAVQRKPALALPYYLRLLAIKPDFDTYYNLGVIYMYQDRHEDAISYLEQALQLEPTSFNTLVNLGAVYLKKEQPLIAAHHYEAALALKPNDPELVYILAALSQASSHITTPHAYIENLFDQYAPHFDQHLQQYLQYQVPDLLLQAVQQEPSAPASFERMLDLGCGTGLCGAAFRPHVKEMIGIDLSENMLEVAKEKGLYNELSCVDIEAALNRYQRIDLIIAGDVFGYVGDLTTTFAAAFTALNTYGLFVFTVERTYEHDFYLQNNARFAHSRDYIEALAAKQGFNILHWETAVLRQQKQQAVEGYVWVLRKGASADE
jgi:predicted TPR repeat methyltransferase